MARFKHEDYHSPEYYAAAKRGDEGRIDYGLAYVQRMRDEGDSEDVYCGLYELAGTYGTSRRVDEMTRVSDEMLTMEAPTPQLPLYRATWWWEWHKDADRAFRFVEQGYAAFRRLVNRGDGWFCHYRNLKRLELAINVELDPLSERTNEVLSELASTTFREGEHFLVPALEAHIAARSSLDFPAQLLLRHVLMDERAFRAQRRELDGEPYQEQLDEIERLLERVPQVDWSSLGPLPDATQLES